ncbi:MAG: NAD(P)H-dependent oxidoreductase [Gordonia paraffinivorans]
MTDSPAVLWLYAHPDHASLNAAIRDGVLSAVRDDGWTVAVDDLHRERWNPVLSDADMVAAAGPTLSERQRAATQAGALPAEVRRRQEMVIAADLIVVQFPLWWYGMPAILKGWFDRVFTNGFAFGIRDHDGHVRKYGDGNLAGRRLLPVVTAGDRATALGERGISGPIDDILWPLLHGTAHYTGMGALRTHLIAEADRMDEGVLRGEVTRLTTRLRASPTEEPIAYRALRGGDYCRDHSLMDPVAPGISGFAAHRVEGAG